MCSMLCILIFIYILTQYFLSDALLNIYGAIGVERVIVTPHVTVLLITS
jgi:hypothetical protein